MYVFRIIGEDGIKKSFELKDNIKTNTDTDLTLSETLK